MGHAIAYVAAAANHPVSIYDPDAATLDALPSRLAAIAELLDDDGAAGRRIAAGSDLKTIIKDADLVIEAAPERLELKRSIFRDLEKLAPSHAILASNTSAIPIGQIADAVTDRARVVGAHFWNPPHLVRLVEVIQHSDESAAAVQRTIDILFGLGWTPVHVRKDIPGFVGNRMQHALKREAIALVAAGVCDAETIDTVTKLGFGARLGVLGPLEQSDMLGLELTQAIHDVLLPDLDTTPHTQDYLNALVASGQTGMKAGRGFREWTPETAQEVRERLDNFLVSQIRNRGRMRRDAR